MEARENTAAYVTSDMWMKLSNNLHLFRSNCCGNVCIKESLTCRKGLSRRKISIMQDKKSWEERFSEYKTEKCCWVGLRRVPGMYTNRDRESLIKEINFVNRILRGRKDPQGIWWCFSQGDHPTFGLFCDKPMSHGQCNMVVERLDDYLIESGI
ncbi:hypothetical protein Bca4012_036484 [Brassica carinata]